jgi:hypothetical protein
VSRPTTGSVADTIWASVEPAVPEDEGFGWPFGIYVAANTGAIQTIDDWVRDSALGIGWSMFLDPDRCPVEGLPWLAEIAGEILPHGTSEGDARTLLNLQPQKERGTVQAMLDAIKATLTGTKFVDLLERVDTAWRTEYFVLESECADGAATLAAAMSQKPAGIILVGTVLAGDAFAWDEATHAWDDGAIATITWDGVDHAHPV